jgi:16S rRNA (adenine1518-N6/adenine1519-N6)-dimethyltransferase
MTVMPKKRFGQNFLHDEIVLQKIKKTIQEIVDKHVSNQQIIEIGPGTGQLTRMLADITDSLIALEIDTEAVEYLTRENVIEGVTVEHNDALVESENSDGYFSNPYMLVSNLPFNVGSRILVNLGMTNPVNAPFVVILQKEVAQKSLKSSNFTLFGAWLNLFWDTRIAFDIPRNSYMPAPDVATSVLVGEPKKQIDYLTYEDRKKLLTILKILVSHPRKTVKANLKYGGYSPEVIDVIFNTHQWDTSLRLTWDNYTEVLRAISGY